MSRYLVSALFLLLALGRWPAPLCAQTSPFPVPEGLQGTVDFWKQVFTRHDSGELILFDPVDPSTIYTVLRAGDSEADRAKVSKERARIAAEYDLADDETRIRSQRGAKEHFVEGLRISGRYMAQIRQIFRDEGLPPQLAYLPLVESSFNVRARSGAGAVGMWQFIAETGKKFMRIDDQVDERRDPLTSTRAAARLLKQNYRILGSWPLALTAYNHGTEGIFRAIESIGSRDLVEMIRRYQSPSFGFASKNFYAEFLAVVEIASAPDRYFPFLRLHPPLALREVEVKKATALGALLKPAAIASGDFFHWNPALESGSTTIPAGYRVKLPAEKVQPFINAQSRAAAPPAKKNAAGARQPAVKPALAQPNRKAATSRVAAKAVPGRAPARAKEPAANALTARRSLNLAAR